MRLLTFKKNNSCRNNYKVLADWCLNDPIGVDNYSLKKYETKYIILITGMIMRN